MAEWATVLLLLFWLYSCCALKRREIMSPPPPPPEDVAEDEEERISFMIPCLPVAVSAPRKLQSENDNSHDYKSTDCRFSTCRPLARKMSKYRLRHN